MSSAQARSRMARQETANAIRALGRTAWTASADLANRDELEAMIAGVERDVGAIDILVNNGGSIARHPAVDFPADEWDRVLRTNLDAVFFLSQHVGREMIERRSGKIINVASLLSFSGGITVPAYTASKHAVAGLTKALANEWAKYDVQINAIAPGYFSTDNTQRLREDRAALRRDQRADSRRPLGRSSGSRRRGRVSRVAGKQLHQRPRPRRRRGLDGSIGQSMQYTPDAQRTKRLTTDELRDGFLVQGLFASGEITLRHIDLDRVVLGGAVPLETPLRLDAPPSLAAQYFTERRELGVLNIGAPGSITVDGKRHPMESRDVLYIGRGSLDIAFASDDASRPARYYIVSYPAHTVHPTTHAPVASADVVELGTTERANRRQSGEVHSRRRRQERAARHGRDRAASGQCVEHDAVAHAPSPDRDLSVLQHPRRRDGRAPHG